MKAFNIWVTRRCNLRCSYCYEGMEKEQRDLNVENVKEIADFIKRMGEEEEYLTVNFHGGEPLLNMEAVLKICEALWKEEKIIYYTLTTNGFLLNEEIVEQLMKYRISLSISLDGTKEYHDRNRVDGKRCGTYERCIRNALLAKQMGMDIRIRMTVTPNNYMGLVESVQHLWSLGFETIVAAPDFYTQEWEDKDLEKIKNALLEIKQYPKKERTTFSFLEEKLTCKGRCGGGVQVCNIDTDLSLYPCTYGIGKKELCIGTVENGIEEKYLWEIQKLGKKKNPECEDCGLEPYCISTRCKIINMQLMGEYYKVAPVICGFQRLIYYVYH